MTRLLTVAEVAERLNTNRRAVYHLIHTRQIPVQKLGDRPKSPVRIDERDLQAWLDRNRIEAAS